MKRLNVVAMIVWLFLPAEALAQSQQTSGIEPIRAVNQQLVSAIGARDIDAMDKVWAHEGLRLAQQAFAGELFAGLSPHRIETRDRRPCRSPLIKIIADSASDMVREFGLTPVARTRIAAGIHQRPPPSKFAGLLAGDET